MIIATKQVAHPKTKAQLSDSDLVFW